jgi:RNA:NAD 2'-phosphotransferase (TPT1/KptA family)
MIEDGEKIWISNNGVYLAKSVDPKYFIETIYG